ncbi:hypothetical protein F5B17DRAFT_269241 [Nemania serpens]|nr:hypothetical protein F5B17DRAFT_269241 [Nemania serpens]
MPAAALPTLLARACLALAIAALVSPTTAQDASVAPQDFADYFTRWKMALALETEENAPIGSQYDVIPLTMEAGLQQTDLSKVPAIRSDLVLLDYSNYTGVAYADKVVFLSCDSNTTLSENNMLTPDRVLNSIMNNAAAPAAILLYSTTKPICFLGGPNLPYTHVWSMASQDDALKVRNILTTTTTEPVVASITLSAKAVETPPPRPGGTSTIAMSILYSITGLITLLFLLIIATGAVRAHRNPERYGPRASVNGRPRRSRARGIAIAMLETLPIVKFSESDQRKPDEELALENSRGVQPVPQDASQVIAGNAPHNDAAPDASSEIANNTVPQHESESAPVPVSATPTPDKAKDEPKSDEDHPGCSICTEDFTVGEDVRVLPCNHKFHPACVDPWLVNVSGTCPLCRLDLRPPEDVEPEEHEEAAAAPPDAASPADGHLAPPPAEADQPATSEAANRRRRSRLLDWNRLRHASVDERLHALRQYRQSEQSSDPSSSTADDERRHLGLTGRLRERLHIRSDSRNNASASASASVPAAAPAPAPSPAPTPAPTPRNLLPPAATVQH